MTQPGRGGLLSASFRLNAPCVNDEEDELNLQASQHQAPGGAAQQHQELPSQSTQRQPKNDLGPGFRLNATQMYEEEDAVVGEDSNAGWQQRGEAPPAQAIDHPNSSQFGNASTTLDEEYRGTSVRTEQQSHFIGSLATQRPAYPGVETQETEPTTSSATTTQQQQNQQTPRDDSGQPPEATSTQPPSDAEKDSTGGLNAAAKGSKTKWPAWLTKKVAIVSVVVIVLLMILVILLVIFLPEDDQPNPEANKLTLAAIKARGTLHCGVRDRLGFSAVNSTTGKREGLEVDLCRAIGAAIFGSDGHVQYTVVSIDNQFTKLQSRDVDLLAAGTMFTIQRDVFEPSTKTGFTFSVPYYYNGMGFAGLPHFVACAEARNTTGSCSNLTICVQDVSTYTPTLTKLFSGFSGIKLAPSQLDLYYDFRQNLCYVIAAERSDLMRFAVTQVGYTGQYDIGLQQFSKEPLALVTRDDDAEWSDFVNWVLLGLLSAETQNITQTTAASVVVNPSPAVNGTPISFYSVVATVGNYGEIYQRNLAYLIPRAYVNMLNNRKTPLISSIPFGDMNIYGPGPTSGGTLDRITNRGFLRCSTTEAAFFSNFDNSTRQWSGFDIDFCRAVAAALFGASNSTNTVFIDVTAANRFQMLANGVIDIISRTTSIAYDRDVDEPTTGKGFTFTQPYFYSGLQFGGKPPYGECADDLNVVSTQCKNLLICVAGGTTTIDAVRRLFPDRFIKSKTDKNEVAHCLVTNESNAIAGTGFDTANATIREVYSGPYEEGTKVFSRDNFALVTNQDDPQWSSFVFLVVTAIFNAREEGVSKSTFGKMPVVNLFGPMYTTMLRNAIRAVGNYEEIYNRNAESKYSRAAINDLNVPPYGPQHFPPKGLFGLV